MHRVLVLSCSVLTTACGAGVFINPVYPPGEGTTGGSTGAGAGGSTGTSTGAVISGTSTGPLSNVGCSNDAGLPGKDQFMGCLENIDCACPLACEADLDFGLDGIQCENLCPGDAGYCDDVETICRQGICRTNFCGADEAGDPRPGVVGGLCQAVGGPSSGTCLPLEAVMPTSEMPTAGICWQGGNLAVGTECNNGSGDFFSRADALCEAGSACQGAVCVAVGPGGCVVWPPDSGQSNPGYGDHHECVTSSYCDCPLSCIQRVASAQLGLCEAPCEDGGGCQQPACVDAGVLPDAGCHPRICSSGYCD